jgi:hypothetical protein
MSKLTQDIAAREHLRHPAGVTTICDSNVQQVAAFQLRDSPV